MNVPQSVEQLITALRRLPGVGPKTAQRYVFHLLARDRQAGGEIALTLQNALERISHCKQCNNYSESEICDVCSSPSRDRTQLCIVETPADMESFEDSGAYQGLYFVLMGRISPMDGIGPDDLNIDELLDTVEHHPIKEIVIATNSTVEGDATADYLTGVLAKRNINATRLARGLPLGGEIEYMDKGTLVEAFQRRVPL